MNKRTGILCFLLCAVTVACGRPVVTARQGLPDSGSVIAATEDNDSRECYLRNETEPQPNDTAVPHAVQSSIYARTTARTYADTPVTDDQIDWLVRAAFTGRQG